MLIHKIQILSIYDIVRYETAFHPTRAGGTPFTFLLFTAPPLFWSMQYRSGTASRYCRWYTRPR